MPSESLEQYVARLEETRRNLAKTITREPVRYSPETKLVASRTIAMAEFKKALAELRAIQATRLFRLRSSLAGLRNRLRSSWSRKLMARGFETSPADDGSGWPADYELWLAEVDRVQEFEEAFIQVSIQAMTEPPLMGIAMAVESRDIASLFELFSSLSEQFYDRFWFTLAILGEVDEAHVITLKGLLGQQGELIHIPGSSEIAAGLNECLNRQQAEWVLAMRYPGVLPKHALYVFADAVTNHPGAELIYSDEDFLDSQGKRCRPNFKPDWNEPLLLSTDYLGSSVLFHSSKALSLGGFKSGLGSAVLWDMWLRYTEGLPSRAVVHLPFILLHRPYSADENASSKEGVVVVEHALKRRQLLGSVSLGSYAGTTNIRLHTDAKPKVSLIIPTKNQVRLLHACIQSIDSVTDYPNFEYVIVDNGSDDAETLSFLAELGSRPNTKIVRDPSPFNYSGLNNLGAFHASGEILGLINDDLEVTDRDWMSHLVFYALRPETGIVGARLLYPDQTIQHAGVAIGFSNSLLEHALQRLDPPLGGHQTRVHFDQWMCAVMGACMFVRKAVFEQIGGLDAESFPVVCNDVDLCLKARLAGYQNVYAGSVSCIHHESKSRGTDDTAEKIRFTRMASAAFALRWGIGYYDPYYNPNIALGPAGFQVSFSPRIHPPWYK